VYQWKWCKKCVCPREIGLFKLVENPQSEVTRYLSLQIHPPRAGIGAQMVGLGPEVATRLITDPFFYQSYDAEAFFIYH
jgi:hypothetical protein